MTPLWPFPPFPRPAPTAPQEHQGQAVTTERNGNKRKITVRSRRSRTKEEAPF